MSDDADVTIGVDIGGTKIAAGVVDRSGQVVDRTQRSTPASDPEAIGREVAACVAELEARHRVGGVGVAAAGFISSDRSRVLFAPNLSWRDEPLRERLEKLTGQSVVVENDANAVAWAEYRFGAGRGHQHVVAVTLGTGVGGGAVVAGALLRGGHGIAAEVGHVRAVPRGRLCGCGNEGCWEQYVSGSALVAEARARAAADPAWSPTLLAGAGGRAEAIEGPAVTAAARAGDRAAEELIDEFGRDVGVFCASLVAVLDPEVIVIGGGVSAAGDLFLDAARAGLAANLSGRGHRPVVELRAAEFVNDAGLVGVADLARIPAG